MIALVDYGVGNLFSLKSSFDAIGESVLVTNKEGDLKAADKIILPGVGAFGDAAKKLKETGLGEIVKEEAKSGKPLMGICLGMQLLLETGYEYGVYEGLGLIPGEVRPIQDVIPKDYKIPQFVGNPSPIFRYIKEGDCVYFVHSFYATRCASSVIATAEYGAPLTAAVAKDNVYGCQFHPEKSGTVGLNILKAFCELK